MRYQVFVTDPLDEVDPIGFRSYYRTDDPKEAHTSAAYGRLIFGGVSKILDTLTGEVVASS